MVTIVQDLPGWLSSDSVLAKAGDVADGADVTLIISPTELLRRVQYARSSTHH
jgi:hypothetical protein